MKRCKQRFKSDKFHSKYSMSLVICAKIPRHAALAALALSTHAFTVNVDDNTKQAELEDSGTSFSGFDEILRHVRSTLPSELSCPEKEVNAWIEKISKVSDVIPESFMEQLDSHLIQRTFMVGRHVTLVDFIVFGFVYEYIKTMPVSNRFSLPSLCRWFDYLQNKFIPNDGMFSLVEFILDVPKIAIVKGNAVDDSIKKAKEEKKAKKAKERKEKAKIEAVSEIAKLDIRVGRVVDASIHPTRDDLFIELIDVGEEKPRPVVTGLAPFISLESFKNRLVAIVCNLEPAEIHGEQSNGLVLCASNEDHSQVEPLAVPEGSKIGESIECPNVKSDVEAVVNAKKWRKIWKKLSTTESDLPIVVFDDKPLQTHCGPLTARISKAVVK